MCRVKNPKNYIPMDWELPDPWGEERRGKKKKGQDAPSPSLISGPSKKRKPSDVQKKDKLQYWSGKGRRSRDGRASEGAMP